MLLPPLVFRTFELAQPQLIISWSLTEWLISYQDGFVRRGLAGELVRLVATTTGVPPSIVITVLVTGLFIALCAVMWLQTRSYLPAWLIFSPLLVGLPLFSNVMGRKDILLVLAFFACMTAIFARWPVWLRLVVINLVSVLAILCHEAFIFVGLPMVLYAYSHVAWGRLDIVRAGIRFLPALAAAGLVLVFKGDAGTARAITEDWNGIFSTIAPDYCCYVRPESALKTIGWTPLQGLRLPFRELSRFWGPVWVPLIWAATLFLAMMAISVSMKRDDFITRSFQLRLFEIQALCGLPLFLLGSDYGRWIFLILITSVVAGALWTQRAPACRPEHRPRVLPFLYPRSGMGLAVFVVFFAAVPGCCWSLFNYGKPLPPVAVLRAVYGLAHLTF